MGMKDEMEKFEKFKDKSFITATFVHNEDESITTDCEVNATGDEIDALIISLAEQVCIRENISPVEFFGRVGAMATLDFMRKGDKK